MEKLYTKAEVYKACLQFYWMGFGAAKGNPSIDDLDLQPHSIIRETVQPQQARPAPQQARPAPQPQEKSEDDEPAWGPPNNGKWTKPTLRSHHGAKRIWTKSKVRQAAAKFKTRNEFYLGDRSAYNAAIRYGYMDSVCKHMAPPHSGTRKTRRKWTEESILAESQKYATRSELIRNDPALYSTIVHRKMQKKVFAPYAPARSASVLREPPIVVNGPTTTHDDLPSFEDIRGM